MKLRQISLAVALTAVAASAQAGIVVKIDPDNGAGDPTIDVGALDWAPGSSLAVPVTGNAQAPAVGDIIQTYNHARLSAFLDAGANGIGGLNLNGPTSATNYEWTFVAAFRERVSAVAGAPGSGSAVFDVISGGDNWFKIYYDPTPDGTPLAGTGFGPVGVTDDDVLILSGTVTPYNTATGRGRTNFSISLDPGTGLPIVQDFDEFSPDNYPAIDSLTGTGGGILEVDVQYVDTAYFPDFDLSKLIVSALFDTQINAPFTQTNPSSCFWNNGALISGAGPNTAGGPCTVNTVGTVNLQPEFDQNGNPITKNNMFMTDATTSFVVPEPATLALLGLGLAGLGLSLRRRSA